MVKLMECDSCARAVSTGDHGQKNWRELEVSNSEDDREGRKQRRSKLSSCWVWADNKISLK